MERSSNLPSDASQPSGMERSSNLPSDASQPSGMERSSNLPSDESQPTGTERSSNLPSDESQPAGKGQSSGSAEEPSNGATDVHISDVTNFSSDGSASSGNALSASSVSSGVRPDGDKLYIVNLSESSKDTTYSGDSSSGSSYTLEYPPRCEHFVDAENLQRPDPKRVNSARVRHSLVRHDEGLSRKDPTELLDLLRKARDDKSREPIRQTLLTRKLRRLAEAKKLADVSKFLTVSDASIQTAVGVILEKQLLQLQLSEDSSVTEELLTVCENTQQAFLHTGDDSQGRVLCYLHLMAVSAVLSRCPRPTDESCSAFVLTTKKQKQEKLVSDSNQVALLKALLGFYDGFKDELGKRSSFSVWANMECSKRKERLQRAPSCELFVSAYTLFNEVAQQGWNNSSITLLETVKFLYKTSARTGKHQLSTEVKSALDFFLTRGLVTLLKTTFKEGMPQVGEGQLTHTREITDLIVDVIKGANSDEREYLMKEVSLLPFHSAVYIRQVFNLLLRTDRQRLSDLTLSLMETKLMVAQFQREPTTSAKTAEERVETCQDECSWQTVPCRMGQKPAEAVIYVPKASCMAGSQLEKCISYHPWAKEQCPKRRQMIAERSERHSRNMDFLKKLSPKCDHLLQLLSYQFKPFPFFVTEPVENRRLLGYLLKHRREQRWLDTATLVHITKQILQGLTFLADRNIVTRDVTAYNMIVDMVDTEEKDSSSGFLNSKCIIKLADLGLAHEFRKDTSSYHDTENRPVRDQGPIPVRWTAPEALFEGRHTDKSMVYSLGCVMYELWTHGCQPFTSYDSSKTTEDLLIQMFGQPENASLYHWPCIPDDVFGLIQRCTHPSPDQRPSLTDVGLELQNLGQGMELEDPGLEEALCLENQYPVPSPAQVKRNHKPETGIPTSVQELMKAGKNNALYTNTRKSQWISMSNVAVTDEELRTLDWMDIENKDDRTTVKEVVTAKFTHEVLPSIEANDLPGVTWVSCDEGTANRAANWQDGLRVHEREYPPCKDLHTAARKGLLWQQDEPQQEDNDSTYDAVGGQDDPKCLVVFKSLARAVAILHERGFLVRDIRAKYILADSHNGQAFLARIGRMCRLPSSDNGHRFVVGDAFQDSYRWLAPEVLISGQYGPENDVFMLGTTIWETFWVRDVALRDPAATEKSYAPCTDILKEQVLDFVRDNTPLPMVREIPDWLYELILQCRHPDPTKRPDIHTVLGVLQQHITSDQVPEPFFENTTPDFSLCMKELTYEPSPVVPRRRRRSIRTKQERSIWKRITRSNRTTKKKLSIGDIHVLQHTDRDTQETDRKMVSAAAAGSPDQGNQRRDAGRETRNENPYRRLLPKDTAIKQRPGISPPRGQTPGVASGGQTGNRPALNAQVDGRRSGSPIVDVEAGGRNRGGGTKGAAEKRVHFPELHQQPSESRDHTEQSLANGRPRPTVTITRNHVSQDVEPSKTPPPLTHHPTAKIHTQSDPAAKLRPNRSTLPCGRLRREVWQQSNLTSIIMATATSQYRKEGRETGSSSTVSDLETYDSLHIWDRQPDGTETTAGQHQNSDTEAEEEYRDCVSVAANHLVTTDLNGRSEFSAVSNSLTPGDQSRERGGEESTSENSYHLLENEESDYENPDCSSDEDSETTTTVTRCTDDAVDDPCDDPQDRRAESSSGVESQEEEGRDNGTHDYEPVLNTADSETDDYSALSPCVVPDRDIPARRSSQGSFTLRPGSTQTEEVMNWDCLPPSDSACVDNPMYQSDSSVCLRYQGRTEEVFV